MLLPQCCVARVHALLLPDSIGLLLPMIYFPKQKKKPQKKDTHKKKEKTRAEGKKYKRRKQPEDEVEKEDEGEEEINAVSLFHSSFRYNPTTI